MTMTLTGTACMRNAACSACMGIRTRLRSRILACMRFSIAGRKARGIVAGDGGQLIGHRDIRLVSDVFKPHRLKPLSRRHGDWACTLLDVWRERAGERAAVHALVQGRKSVALCHNGNLTNAARLREELEEDGHIFQATSDTEVIIHLIAKSREETFPWTA